MKNHYLFTKLLFFYLFSISIVATADITAKPSQPFKVSQITGDECPHDGDVNMDGKVTIKDVSLAFKFLFDPLLLTQCQKNHADVDCDGDVTVNDISCIFKSIFGVFVPDCKFNCTRISDAAFSLISNRVNENKKSFYIYKDGDSGFNHGFPSGLFGQVNKIEIDTACIDDSGSANGCSQDPNVLDKERGNVMRISFDPLLPGEFAGINIEEPENWGVLSTGMGYDITGATQMVFDVRSAGIQLLKVQFGIGGEVSEFLDIPEEWTEMSLPIPESIDSTNIHRLFTIVTNDLNAPNGGTILLDNIRLEPVPINQSEMLSFPISTQTFGVIPFKEAGSGRVTIPSDQAVRNLTTTYESALAIIALLNRGNQQDVDDAHLIADTFLYALEHDNSGDPLPTGPNGNVGLHNGYISGDIALFNGQGEGAGRKGEIRLSGFSASANLCGPSGFCLLLDGATGGNNAFAILALLAVYNESNDSKYLDGARTIANWIKENLRDTTNTGFGGYFLGYPDAGEIPKLLITGKSVENNADIFVAFHALSKIENELGDIDKANEWTNLANEAGDFVMEMFDPDIGHFHAGTVPVGTEPSPGIKPDGTIKGNEAINTFEFLDADTFTTLAMAWASRYKDQIDWRKPVLYALDNFTRIITVNDDDFEGFNIEKTTSAGPDGIAWEFTAQVVVTMLLVDSIYEELRFKDDIAFYLNQIQKAQRDAPFGDGLGIVASTLLDGDQLAPIDQCLSTPFQCIPERVGLAATTWAIFAEMNINPLFF